LLTRSSAVSGPAFLGSLHDQNAYGESFNGRFRDECLNLEWYHNLAEARVVIEQWRQHYNAARPHSSLGYQTPEAFRLAYEQQLAAAGSTHWLMPALTSDAILHV
jgi:transposase InsO family protein